MLLRTGAQKIVVFALMFTMILLSSFAFVTAQYTTEKTTNISIPDSGTFKVAVPEVGVTYEIIGAPGSTGSVTATVYNGNPQVTATIPADISLTRFIAVTFNIATQNFMQATLTFNYSDADVANLKAPYAIYKYISESNSYVELASVVDDAAKTITVTLTSTNDPLFAIGGVSTAADNGTPTLVWVAIAAIVIIIVVVAVLLIKRFIYWRT